MLFSCTLKWQNKQTLSLPRSRKSCVTAVCFDLALCWCTHLAYPHHPKPNHVQVPDQGCAARHAGSRGDPHSVLERGGEGESAGPLASGSLTSLFGDSDSEQQRVLCRGMTVGRRECHLRLYVSLL